MVLEYERRTVFSIEFKLCSEQCSVLDSIPFNNNAKLYPCKFFSVIFPVVYLLDFGCETILKYFVCGIWT